MSKYTTETWVKKAKELHPNTSYDGIEYKNNKEKMSFFCIKHNISYEQNAKSHIYGYEGCPLCKKEKFTELAREKLGKSEDQAIKDIKENIKSPENLDFSEVKYVNAMTPLKIICNVIGENGEKHGAFYPMIYNIMAHKCGCPKCAKENHLTYNKIGKDEIIKRIKNIHGDKYDLSLIKDDIKNIDDTITLVCKTHGNFEITPHRIFGTHQGCPKCGRINGGYKNRLGYDNIINKANKIHGCKYDYSLLPKDIKWEDKVRIICPIHGEFIQKIGYHLQGQGCPLCNESKLEKEVRIFLENKQIDFNSQKKFEWLGRQTVDFYLPQYNIAIECQGSQHFLEDHFMKELKLVKERDLRKKKLCVENNIKLIYYLDNKYSKYMDNNDVFFTNIDDLYGYIDIYKEKKS